MAGIYGLMRGEVGTVPTPADTTSRGARTARAPGALARLALRRVLATIATWRHAGVTLRLPDGREVRAGASSGTQLVVTVHDWSFFVRVLLDADIGAGESYARGDWDCDDLAGLLGASVEARSASRGAACLAWLSAARHAPLRTRRLCGAGAAARNVCAHYDQGDDFFSLFLDPSMTYSSAVYPASDATLEQAQELKLDLACRSLGLGPGMNVLDVGCGWGGFALHAAKRYGCRVTAVTLSPAQAAWARARVGDARLEDRVDVQLRDYRDVRGTFDAICCIEMLEAVGYRGYRRFFRKCAARLARGGRMFLQVIVFPGADYARYRFQYDFVRKHVFPGGLLPSQRALVRALGETGFCIEEMRDGASHYARTLGDWRRRLTSHRAAGLALPSSWIRSWEFYFAICEAGFSSGHLGLMQASLTSRFS
jgi:cyclopropane-fatty-acyl-phospholipid synthase